MLHQLLNKADPLIGFTEVSAHCDVPCKIYDPATAQIATLSVIRFLDLINELNDQTLTLGGSVLPGLPV